METPSKLDVLLIQAPCVRWTFLVPAGIACLVGFLRSNGYKADAIDGDMTYKKHLPLYRLLVGLHRLLISSSKPFHRKKNNSQNQQTYGFSTEQGSPQNTSPVCTPGGMITPPRNPIKGFFGLGFSMIRGAFYMVERSLKGWAESSVYEPDLRVEQVLASFDTGYPAQEKRLERALGKQITDANADIVGISIQYPDQMLLGLILAKLAKKINPNCYVVLGGPQITAQIEQFTAPGPLVKYVDGVMVHETEVGLRELIEARRDNAALNKVSNLYFKDGESFTASERVDYQLPVAEYAIPDFSGFNLSDYGYGLPIRSLRGCYYNKCTFCTYPVTGGQYAFTSADFVVNNMIALQEKYQVSTFEIIDSSLPAKYLRQISQAIIDRGLNVKWYTRANVQKDFKDAELVQLMAKAGCIALYLGVESGSDRIVNMMKKMQPGKDASLEIIESLYNNGVQPAVYSMFGYPTETKEEMEESVEFFMMLNRRFRIGVKNANQFNLVTDSPMFYDPEPYGIINIRGSVNAAQGYGFEYDVTRGMTPPEAAKLCRKAGIFFRHPFLAKAHKKVYGRTL
jgi:hypothetical protein